MNQCAFLRIESRVRTNALNSTGGHLRRDGVRFEFRATKAGVAGGKCTTMVARTGEPASSQMAVQAILLYPLEKEICQHGENGKGDKSKQVEEGADFYPARAGGSAVGSVFGIQRAVVCAIGGRVSGGGEVVYLLPAVCGIL